MKTGLKQIDKKYDCTLDRAYSLELSDEDEEDFCSRNNLPPDCAQPCSSNVTVETGDKITVTIDPCTGAKKYYEELPKCVAMGMFESIVFEGLPQYNEKATCGVTISDPPAADEPKIVSCTDKDGATITPPPGGTISLIFTGFDITIQNLDPLMVWHFPSGILEGDKIRYYLENLQEEVTADCLREIEGVVTEMAGDLTAGILETLEPAQYRIQLTHILQQTLTQQHALLLIAQLQLLQQILLVLILVLIFQQTIRLFLVQYQMMLAA